MKIKRLIGILYLLFLAYIIFLFIKHLPSIYVMVVSALGLLLKALLVILFLILSFVLLVWAFSDDDYHASTHRRN